MIDKSIGERSTRCVEIVRRAAGKGVKVGHGGTLDSTASGVLVILLGSATRLSNIVMGMKKVYRASIKLGVSTDTCDYAGNVTHEQGWQDITDDDVDRCLMSFLGWREQIPPKISAVHVNGRRAHEVFRAGEDLDIMPRAVHIVSLTRGSCIDSRGIFDIRVECGKGTYIRSIARDIGTMLGCGAHIASLRRERVGIFESEGAFVMGDEVHGDDIERHVLPIAEIGKFLPMFSASSGASQSLKNGLKVPLRSLTRVTSGDRPPVDMIVAGASDMLSVCRLAAFNDAVYAVPSVNISDKGSASA